jgi:proteic killer suppression protein
MIQSYRPGKTQRFVDGDIDATFRSFERLIWKRLLILDAAETVRDLAALNSNRLEKLGGDRAGSWSIRINRRWRICFDWPEGAEGPSDVEIVDYH